MADPDLMVYSTSDSIAGAVLLGGQRAWWTRARRSWPRCRGWRRRPALAPDLQLPAAYRTTALKKLADRQAAGQTTEFGKVNALATWLSGPQFIYSLAAPQLTSAASLVNFLTKVKSGFCVQYAYAMTVLTRLLGIPARFVVGYTGGTRLKDGSYQVKNTDAHAWTEVYFPTLGWIRFEPTPAGQGTANAPDYMTGGAGHGPARRLQPDHLGATQSPGASKTPPRPGGPAPLPGRVTTAGCGGRAAERAATPWAAIALAVIAALVLALGLISVVAAPTQQLLTGHPGVSRRRPRAATAAVGGRRRGRAGRPGPVPADGAHHRA